VAAAGRHHLVLQGPTGSGKTLLARCLPGLLPPLTETQKLDVQRIHSVAGIHTSRADRQVPFRAPDHTSSLVAVLGGGTSWLRPGEVSCAHHGVLFLDDLAEFAPPILDGIHQTIDRGEIVINRAHQSVIMPAKFLLVGSLRPCACDPVWKCRCSQAAVQRYQRRIDTRLMLKFDLRVTTTAPQSHETHCPWTTAEVREWVIAAANLAVARQGCMNADIPDDNLDQVAQLNPSSTALVEDAMRVGLFSHRSVGRVRRIARTIADLQGAPGMVLSDDVVATAIGMHQLTTTTTGKELTS
jgi:magnesium chelatase family protein